MPQFLFRKSFVFILMFVLAGVTVLPQPAEAQWCKVRTWVSKLIGSGEDKCNAPEYTPPPKNQCENGIDDDGDGKVDYPADGGCSEPIDNSEQNIVCGLFSCSVAEDDAPDSPSAACMQSFDIPSCCPYVDEYSQKSPGAGFIAKIRCTFSPPPADSPTEPGVGGGTGNTGSGGTGPGGNTGTTDTTGNGSGAPSGTIPGGTQGSSGSELPAITGGFSRPLKVTFVADRPAMTSDAQISIRAGATSRPVTLIMATQSVGRASIVSYFDNVQATSKNIQILPGSSTIKLNLTRSIPTGRYQFTVNVLDGTKVIPLTGSLEVTNLDPSLRER